MNEELKTIVVTKSQLERMLTKLVTENRKVGFIKISPIGEEKSMSQFSIKDFEV